MNSDKSTPKIYESHSGTTSRRWLIPVPRRSNRQNRLIGLLVENTGWPYHSPIFTFHPFDESPFIFFYEIPLSALFFSFIFCFPLFPRKNLWSDSIPNLISEVSNSLSSICWLLSLSINIALSILGVARVLFSNYYFGNRIITQNHKIVRFIPFLSDSFLFLGLWWGIRLLIMGFVKQVWAL